MDMLPNRTRSTYRSSSRSLESENSAHRFTRSIFCLPEHTAKVQERSVGVEIVNEIRIHPGLCQDIALHMLSTTLDLRLQFVSALWWF